MKALLLLLVFSALPARADTLDAAEVLGADEARLNRTEHRLMLGLLSDGAISVAAGAGLLAPGNNDQAWRVAGGVTLTFGVIDVVLGISGTLGTARELRNFIAAQPAHRADLVSARRAGVAAPQKKATVFALNLGLDVGYITGGSVAILASQLGVDHSGRWLAGGSAAAIQGLALGVIDLVGMLAAQRIHF